MVQGSNTHRVKRYFSLSKCPDLFWGLPSLLFNGYWVYFLGLKRLGREVDLPLSSAEVKKEWSYTSAAPICCHGVQREDFMFLVTAVSISLFVVQTHTQSGILFLLL
jgi:hypothetical protein